MKDRNMLMQLSDKIYILRKNAGYSQEQLAEKLDVSRQAVSKWEIGSAAPELDNVVAIAKLFGVTCDWLLMDDVKRASDNVKDEEKKPEIQAGAEKEWG